MWEVEGAERKGSPFFMALSMSRSSSLAWLFWGSVCSSPRTYFSAFSYSCTQGKHTDTHTLSILALLLPIRVGKKNEGRWAVTGYGKDSKDGRVPPLRLSSTVSNISLGRGGGVVSFRIWTWIQQVR